MSGKQFVNDKRFISGIQSKSAFLSVLLRITVILVSTAFIFGLIYGSIYFSQKITNRKDFEAFIMACETKDYSQAISVYRKLQGKVLSKSVFIFHKDEIKGNILKMEAEVNKLIEKPYKDLVTLNQPFSNKDIQLYKDFQELSNRKLFELTVEYLEGFLLGEYDINGVKKTFNELRKIQTLSETVSRYESELSQINAFSPLMISIKNSYSKKDYLAAALDAKIELEKQSGFIKEYLTGFYLDCKKVMYPILKNEVDVMMSGSKYYTAKSLINQLNQIFPDDIYLQSQLNICNEKVPSKLYEYFYPIEHLSIRPLIAAPELAFDNDAYSKNAEDLMLTASEFGKILEQIYLKSYILIDINMLVDSSGNKNKIFLPEGKKPIIISIEGLNYYAGRSQSGNSENLSIDKNNNIVSTYKKAGGQQVTDRNGEAIGILEQFVEAHPDFSFDGAKGNISLTGFECIFGYVTDQDQVEDRAKAFRDNHLQAFTITSDEIETNKRKVLAIIKRLKGNGWSFSSSTYGSIQVGEASMEQLVNDTTKWILQVESLTGKVKALLFPNGNFVGSKDPKGAYLISKGFTIHAGIGPTAYFNYSGKNLYMDRIALNGLALRFQNLNRFFDVKTVYDPLRKNALKK